MSDRQAQHNMNLTMYQDAAYARRISKEVVAGIAIKDSRSPGREVLTPGSPGYKNVLARVRSDMRKRDTTVLMVLLCQHRNCTAKNFFEFEAAYRHRFDEKRWESVVVKQFPYLNQRAIQTITGMSPAGLSSRLDDLESIGLITREELVPGNGNYVSVTDKGLQVMRKAVCDGRELRKFCVELEDSIRREISTADETEAIADLTHEMPADISWRKWMRWTGQRVWSAL